MHRLSLGSIAVAGSFLTVAAAPGAFTGLGATSRSATTSGGFAVDVFELFATFDSAADGAAAVGGTPLFPQILNSGGGGFLQVTVFGAAQDVPVGAAAVEAIPDLAYDSFLSIGVRQGFTGTPAVPTIQGYNLDDFNGGADLVTSSNGGWFIGAGPEIAALPWPPPVAPGVEFLSPSGATHATFLGQFAVAAGHTFDGDLGQLLIFENDVARFVDFNSGALFSFSRPLPAPGALPLFALLAVSRRRRRSRRSRVA